MANVVWAVRASGHVATVDAMGALEGLGVGACAHRHVAEMSGGEQLRVALAAAMARSPSLTLVDEPTATLDRQSAHTVAGALRATTDRGATVVVATHDRTVIDVADVVVTLDHGRRLS